MKTVLSTALIATTLIISSIASAAPAHTPEKQALFEEFKRIESRSHQGRIAILQEAEICIQQAQNREAFRACEEKEKAGRQALRAELKPQREALREQAKALGITMRHGHSPDRQGELGMEN
jgi:hypothetical protein